MSCARIVIAATGSGVGKTSTAIALVRSLRRRGLRVQTFKVGPDFLDPTHLAVASDRPCYNLDGWMCGKDYVLDLFKRKTADADIAVIEGVMGLFDGASPENSEGSTAEIARWLEAPVLLVAGAHGVARSMAATVKGFTTLEPGLKLAGVIANYCGSDRQALWLASSLVSASLPPLLGAIPRGAFLDLPSRHLGLVTANHQSLSATTLDAFADALEQHVQVDEIIRQAGHALPLHSPVKTPAAGAVELVRRSESGATLTVADVVDVGLHSQDRDHRSRLQKIENGSQRPRPQKTLEFSRTAVTIGIARDDAFHFYYPDTLEALQSQGARLVPFSPLGDSALPDALDAVYLGGGYPEEYAAALSRNLGLLDALRVFVARGGVLYAECGGLMYLSQGIETCDGARYSMAGVLPFWTRMSAQRKALGYVEVTLRANSFWGRLGDVLRGHEFHYSEIMNPTPMPAGWSMAYEIRYRRETAPIQEGFQRGRVLASYTHLHFASRPGAARAFVEFARKRNPS